MSRRATGRTTSRSPGSTWLDDGYFSVFGNEQSDLSAPYETFNIVQMHVPRGGALGDGVYEVGLAIVAPDANANYPGDYTGVQTAYVNVGASGGTHFWLAGYPMSDAFQLAQSHFGLGQYHCNATWDGDHFDASQGGTTAQLVGRCCDHRENPRSLTELSTTNLLAPSLAPPGRRPKIEGAHVLRDETGAAGLARSRGL
jgi:hypothetical protein